MRSSGKFLKNALECMTQIVLLPGVELHFEDLINYYSKNFGVIIKGRARRNR